MVVTDPFYLDNSTLKPVATCSTQAWLRYWLGYTSPEERAELKSGSAAHEAEAVYFRGGSGADALATYEREYREWSDANVAPDHRLTWENTSKILAYWFETHPRASLPFTIKPDLVEIGFAFPLTDDIVFCGRIDDVAQGRDDRAWYVVENKHTGRISPDWIKQYRMDSQLSGYIWAAQQHTSQPVVGAFVNAIEFSRLPSDPTRKCKKHAVLFPECAHLHATFDLLIVSRTPEALRKWKATAIKLARRFIEMATKWPTIDYLPAVPMEGTFHGACRFCAFHDFCSVGRPANMVSSMLVHEPWKPFDYAQGKREESALKP